MSLAQASPSSPDRFLSEAAKRPWLRSLLLTLLLLLALALNAVLIAIAPPPDGAVTQFVQFWLVSFLPYLAASLLVVFTRASTGRWQWIELGIILLGALVLRAMLIPVPPNLSHDSWRYLWDARVTLHGFSPYVYAPGDPKLAFLRDFLYDNSRFRNVPTIYPPFAQFIYIVSYVLAPGNLYFFKSLLTLFELTTCVALIFLLKHRGLDSSRVLLYAWCPLPIIEFAIQGHLDAITIMLTMLTLLCNIGTWRGARGITGFLLALATLTKIYPLVLLVVVLRRRDWTLLTVCFATILVGYIPYLILGHGQVFGFFATYASEQTPNGGIVWVFTDWLSRRIGFAGRTVVLIEYALDLLMVGSVALAVLLLRWRERLSIEAGALAVFGVVLAASSHVFPWYTTALLPFVVLLFVPLWTRRAGLSGQGIAVIMAWYLACLSITGYFFRSDWHVYYWSVYAVVVVGLVLAAVIGAMHLRRNIPPNIYETP